MSNSLQPHELQHARLLCPSISPGICSDSCLLHQWCHPTISSSVTPFSCPQSFPAWGSFLISQFFALSGQSLGAAASVSVLLMNIQSWLPLGLTGLTSFLSKGLSRVFSSTTVWKQQSFDTLLPYGPTLTSILDYWKSHSFEYMHFCCKVMSLLFNTLSRYFSHCYSTNHVRKMKCIYVYLSPWYTVSFSRRG